MIYYYSIYEFEGKDWVAITKNTEKVIYRWFDLSRVGLISVESIEEFENHDDNSHSIPLNKLNDILHKTN